MATLSKEDILEAIAGMSVLEVSELVSAMEEKFGVTAAAPVAAVAAAPGRRADRVRRRSQGFCRRQKDSCN